MELPKGCASCPITSKICSAFALDKEFKKEDLKFSRHPLCQLVDLGKEDMDFEDLKEKCKNISTGNYNHYFSIRIDSGTIFSFYENGTISIEQENDLTKDDYIEIFNKTPYQMYQIIKSLVGDEK